MRDAPKDMGFEEALRGLKYGIRMTREAWGRPAPWVMLVARPARTRILLKQPSWSEISADIAAIDIQPEQHFLQFTSGHAYAVWTPTTTDILAGDWREYQP